MRRVVSWPNNKVPNDYDTILCIRYTLNKFYDYASKNNDTEDVGIALSALQRLSNSKRKKGLFLPDAFTEETTKALKMLCDFFNHKDKENKYVYGLLTFNELYSCFSNLFTTGKQPGIPIRYTMSIFENNIKELVASGHFDFESKQKCNYIISYDKFGRIELFEVPKIMDHLFKLKIRADIKLIMNLNF